MDVVLTGAQRERLRQDVAHHRAESPHNDADYAQQILRVSLNTFKKIVGPGDRLGLKQRVFRAVVGNAGLDAAAYGAGLSIPKQALQFGGYSRADFGYLIGRYLIYRRSFQDGVAISRAVLDIQWNEPLSCLSFVEMRRYRVDGGAWQANDIRGNIHMHAERVLMGLLAIDEGDVRLTLLHIPSRLAIGTPIGTVRSSGFVLTHGYPKRFFQPVVSPVAIEALGSTRRGLSPNDLNTLITPDAPGHAELDLDLRMAEEHATVVTSLMARAK